MAISGFDKLQRDLEQAGKAFKALEGEITKLSFDPSDPANVSAAIRQLERVIDAKLSSYRGNALVEKLAKDLKEKYRAGIEKRAADSRKKVGSSGRDFYDRTHARFAALGGIELELPREGVREPPAFDE